MKWIVKDGKWYSTGMGQTLSNKQEDAFVFDDLDEEMEWLRSIGAHETAKSWAQAFAESLRAKGVENPRVVRFKTRKEREQE